MDTFAQKNKAKVQEIFLQRVPGLKSDLKSDLSQSLKGYRSFKSDLKSDLSAKKSIF